MSLSITDENKNTLSITPEAKPSTGTFGSFPGRTFADGGTFGEPGTFLSQEAKNSLTITPENKV